MTLKKFDWDAQPAVRQQIAALASGGFLTEVATSSCWVDHIASRIRHLVYLDAFLPDHGESVFSLTGRAKGLMNLDDPWLVAPPARDFDDPAGSCLHESPEDAAPDQVFQRGGSTIEDYSFAKTYIKGNGRSG